MYPDNLRYSKQHEWILETDTGAIIGITHHAQEQLGDIVYVELPEVGDSFEKEEEFGSLESVKAVAEVFMPISGCIVEINELLEDHPDMVNKNPHESGWLVKVKMDEGESLDDMMDAAAYQAFVEEESK